MDDLTAVSYEAEAETLPQQISVGFVEEARTFLTGFVLTAVLTVLGASLVTVALVVGVVGAPVIAVVVAYVLWTRRAQRVSALAT